MRRPLIVMLIGFVLVVLVGWLAGEVVTGVAAPVLVDELDTPTMHWVADNRQPLVDSAMRVVTHLGDRVAVASVLGAAAVASAAFRSRRWTGFFLVSSFGALLLSGTTKHLVDRPRPDVDPLVEIGGLSFPSGHATAAAICYGALAVAALAQRTRSRLVLATICLLTAPTVAVSRVWLGVHYPTDVVAGLALGSCWVALSYIGFLGNVRRSVPA